jgi:hypothetical protein
MMFLHSEKVPKIQSIGQKRSGYSLFRVLTSSYHPVNIPYFPLFFTRFWQCIRRDRPVGYRMNTPLLSEADSIRIAKYLTKFPPQEVPGQNLKGGSGNAQRSARCTDSGKRKEVANGMWRFDMKVT